MSPEALVYLIIGLAASIIATVGGIVRLWLRLRFNKHVVDQAVGQGVPIDPSVVIDIAGRQSP
jgi:hypothetical protein